MDTRSVLHNDEDRLMQRVCGKGWTEGRGGGVGGEEWEDSEERSVCVGGGLLGKGC